MISPHLLYTDASYSQATYLGCLEGPTPSDDVIQQAKDKAQELWGVDVPILTIQPTLKTVQLTVRKSRLLALMPKWQHMILAHGPAMKEDQDGSALIIIWWSEMSPDTDRVLQAVDWEKHAKDFQY